MNKYKVILWDIDGTLLDFSEAERAAIRTCFKKFELGTCTDEMIKSYSAINIKYWEALERGEISKERVLVGRFEEFFASEGLDGSKATAFNEEYQLRLADTCVFRDNAFEIIEDLNNRGYRQYAVTNGTYVAQERKLKNSGLDKLLVDAFISDYIGHEKPSMEFFDAVFEGIEGATAADMIIVGDSLTSDIIGGNNAGIDTCWYNPFKTTNSVGAKVTYEIDNIKQIYEVLNIQSCQV
ncbi:MAG: YjjG family noncanonical pyrimidine nucleotidase [Lachnospiraceae bacterium]|nr:YjjG family noncanonical pyrimidine nucleotidase [Lachnospiraceae bacterium]